MGYRTITVHPDGTKTEEFTSTLQEYKAECVSDLKQKAEETILQAVPVHQQLNAIWELLGDAAKKHPVSVELQKHREQSQSKEAKILKGKTFSDIENIAWGKE